MRSPTIRRIACPTSSSCFSSNAIPNSILPRPAQCSSVPARDCPQPMQIQCFVRALRAVDQKSNFPKLKIQNSFPPIPPAIPPLIKIRCAKMLTKAHHPTSLTEEHDVQQASDHPWRSLAPPRLG